MNVSHAIHEYMIFDKIVIFRQIGILLAIGSGKFAKSMKSAKLNLLNFSDKSIQTLHLTWFAFFLTFVVWFNHAPLVTHICRAFDLTTQQWKALLILNVALTIPARIVIGMLVDRNGPRKTFSLLLIASSGLCAFFALARSYEQLALARLLMGFVGGGFVIGIRMIGEWFPARQVGLAEGIYGGWGNFGSAGAMFLLPTLSFQLEKMGVEEAWRYSLLLTAVLTLVYGLFFYKVARNTPEGSTYFKPKKSGGLEVTSPRDFYFLLFMNLPMYAALGVLAWRVSAGVGLISDGVMEAIWVGLAGLYGWQTWQIYLVNKDMLKNGVGEAQKYKFRQVAILNLYYSISFGTELALISILPVFFASTFNLSPIVSGILTGCFACMNLVARPAGGLFSDRFGRRKSLLILLTGVVAGMYLLSQITPEWPVMFAMFTLLACAVFGQAGSGAVFAMVPLIKRRLTGQIAGMTGAFGNVGGVVFLTVYSFVDTSTCFKIIGLSALGVLATTWFLEEPKGHTVEIAEDGTVELIEVA